MYTGNEAYVGVAEEKVVEGQELTGAGTLWWFTEKPLDPSHSTLYGDLSVGNWDNITGRTVGTATAASGNTSPAATSSGTYYGMHGTQDKPMVIRLKCSTGGAIGSTAKYVVACSYDGGETFSSYYATSATMNTTASDLYDEDGNKVGGSVWWASGTAVANDTWDIEVYPADWTAGKALAANSNSGLATNGSFDCTNVLTISGTPNISEPLRYFIKIVAADATTPYNSNDKFQVSYGYSSWGATTTIATSATAYSMLDEDGNDTGLDVAFSGSATFSTDDIYIVEVKGDKDGLVLVKGRTTSSKASHDGIVVQSSGYTLSEEKGYLVTTSTVTANTKVWAEKYVPFFGDYKIRTHYGSGDGGSVSFTLDYAHSALSAGDKMHDGFELELWEKSGNEWSQKTVVTDYTVDYSDMEAVVVTVPSSLNGTNNYLMIYRVILEKVVSQRTKYYIAMRNEGFSQSVSYEDILEMRDQPFQTDRVPGSKTIDGASLVVGGKMAGNQWLLIKHLVRDGYSYTASSPESGVNYHKFIFQGKELAQGFYGLSFFLDKIVTNPVTGDSTVIAYAGCKIGEVAMAFADNPVVEMTFGGIMGKGADPTHATATPTYTTANHLMKTKAGIEYGDKSGTRSTLVIVGLNMTFGNNLQSGGQRVGSDQIADIGFGMYAITGSITRQPITLSDLFDALKDQHKQLVIDCIGKPISGTSTLERVKFTIPDVQIEPVEPVAGDPNGIIETEIPFTALQSDLAAPYIEVWNTDTEYGVRS